MDRSQTSTNRTASVALAHESAPTGVDTVALLHQFSSDLVAGLDLHPMLRNVLLTAAELVGAQHATLLLLDDAGQHIQYRIALDNGNLAPLELVAKPMMRKGLAGWVARTRTSALVHDTEHDQRWLPGPGLGDLRSALVVPLSYAERVLGILTLGSEQPGHYRSEHMRLIEILAAQAASAIQLAQLAGARNWPPAQPIPPGAQDSVVLAGAVHGLGMAAAQLTPDQCFNDVLQVWIHTLTQITRRHHGSIARVDGDTLLAIFEAANAGARTAACAAIELQEAFQKLSNSWQQRLGLTTALPNMGIASGAALLGHLAADRATCTAVGPAVAQALRLCELARSGEILTCDLISTILSHDGDFQITALPPLQLGASITQQIYQLRRMHTAAVLAQPMLNGKI